MPTKAMFESHMLGLPGVSEMAKKTGNLSVARFVVSW